MSVASKTRSDLSNTTQRPVVKKVTQRSTAKTSNMCSSTMLCCVALMFVILLGISGAALGLSIYNYVDMEPVRANLTHVSELSTVIMSEFDPIDLLAVHDVCKITVACESTAEYRRASDSTADDHSVSEHAGVRFSLTSSRIPHLRRHRAVASDDCKGYQHDKLKQKLLFNNLFLKKACALPDDDDA